MKVKFLMSHLGGGGLLPACSVSSSRVKNGR